MMGAAVTERSSPLHQNFSMESFEVVRVPVLAVKTSVSLPAFSRASSFLMSSFSSFNLSVEKTAQIETARGSPSGTAVITIATAIKAELTISRTVSAEMKPCPLIAHKINWNVKRVPKMNAAER